MSWNKIAKTTLFSAVIGLSAACEAPGSEAPKTSPETTTQVEPQDFEIPEANDLLAGDVDVRDLRLDQPERYMSCFEFFEPSGVVVSEFPFDSDERTARVLWGCGVEATVEKGGARYVAYASAINPKTTTRDLRFVKYQGGKLQWTHLIDRSEQGRNFVANFRRSFITPLGNLTCAGTMWEGGTQTHCLNDETGEAEWEGWMPFWAGFAPQPGDDGLWVADLMAMTKRYPYTGVEMEYMKLPETGGRAALYATAGRSLYFTPSRATPPTLTAIDFGTREMRWQRELPEKPVASYSQVFREQNLLVVIIGQKLVGVDTTDGSPLWAWGIGDDRPSVTMLDGTLYALHRLPESPNSVVALNPKSGERLWRANLPGGILETRAEAGELFFKSIRAVQKVTGGLESAQ